MPTILEGGKFEDDRGILYYNNNFLLTDIKRFHIIEQSPEVFRAWQGHKIENKWFQALSGSYQIFVVKPDDWEKPSKDLNIQSFHLDTFQNNILKISGGHLTGIKALKKGSKLGVFSDLTVEESKLDDFRFPPEYWILK